MGYNPDSFEEPDDQTDSLGRYKCSASPPKPPTGKRPRAGGWEWCPKCDAACIPGKPCPRGCDDTENPFTDFPKEEK